MRILIFHGYLLRGTGSNVYNASLARALVGLGHAVDLLCQDADAAGLPFVDAVGHFDRGQLRLETIRRPVRLTIYLPDIGRTLPVYVADKYERFDAVTFAALSDAALERYLDANVDAVRQVVAATAPDIALANHLVMGPVVLARALAGRVPYAVKVHGSALEYTVRPSPGRFLPYAREGLAGASAVLAGSHHTARSLIELVGAHGLREKLRLGPPGVDTQSFRPRPPDEARRGLSELADRLEGTLAQWGGEAGAAAALRCLDPQRDLIVTYVGKLIVSKGVDLLLAAWPLVAAAVPRARLCVVGFGTYREGLSTLIQTLSEGDLAAARELATRGRELEGGPRGGMSYLTGFLESVARGLPEGYLSAARSAFERVHFSGRLEHEDLPALLAASLAQVVPSTFPEAFGMVAVEAAACGALPLSASHSGLAEVTGTLETALEPPLRPLLSFDLGPDAIEQLARKLVAWLTLDEARREEARTALSDAARAMYGWERVGRAVIAAAEGRLDELPPAGGEEAPSLRPSG